jgi:hypothetical protein
MSDTKQEIVFTGWYFWNYAADSAQRAREIKTTHPRACTADTISAILLAAMSTEAFINELAVRLSLLDIYGTEDSKKWASVGKFLEKLEDEHAQVKSKYLWVSHLLPGMPLAVGANPYQSFEQLIKIRNDFAHPKVQGDEPRYMRDFSQRGWLYNKETDEPKLVGWMMQLQTPQIAAWACRAAHDIIWNIVKRFDVGHLPLQDLYDGLAFQWKKSLNDKRVDI